VQGLAAAGLEVEQDRLESALRQATRSGLWEFEGPFEATADASFERIKKFDAAVLAELGHAELADDVFRQIEAAFEQVSAWYVFPDVEPAIEALRRAGVRLGVISNWLWGAPELMHSLRLERHFEALVISARVGYQKPHPRIFEHALELIGVAPERAIHVGDSYAADVVGARRVGMGAVLMERQLDDPARVRSEHDDPQLAVVGDMFELLDLLGVERPASVGSR